jgi:hypothetical protein
VKVFSYLNQVVCATTPDINIIGYYSATSIFFESNRQEKISDVSRNYSGKKTSMFADNSIVVLRKEVVRI